MGDKLFCTHFDLLEASCKEKQIVNAILCYVVHLWGDELVQEHRVAAKDDLETKEDAFIEEDSEEVHSLEKGMDYVGIKDE